MAQTKRKRQRKHRGTQGGSIDRRGRSGGRPRTREEAKAQARRRSQYRREQTAPTWRSAFLRGLIGAVVFLLVIVLLFSRPFGEGLMLSAIMLGMYVPLGYYVDRFFYRRRRAQEIKQRQAAKAERQAQKNR